MRERVDGAIGHATYFWAIASWPFLRVNAARRAGRAETAKQKASVNRAESFMVMIGLVCVVEKER